MEIRVGVRALESGVVPRNLMMLVGRTSANHVSRDVAELFERRLVLPQPPERSRIKSGKIRKHLQISYFLLNINC